MAFVAVKVVCMVGFRTTIYWQPSLYITRPQAHFGHCCVVFFVYCFYCIAFSSIVFCFVASLFRPLHCCIAFSSIVFCKICRLLYFVLFVIVYCILCCLSSSIVFWVCCLCCLCCYIAVIHSLSAFITVCFVVEPVWLFIVV